MDLVYTKDATMQSNGHYFVKGKIYSVEEKVGKYLLKTFGDMFKEVTPEPKTEPVETKQQTSTKQPTKRRKASTKQEG